MEIRKDPLGDEQLLAVTSDIYAWILCVLGSEVGKANKFAYIGQSIYDQSKLKTSLRPKHLILFLVCCSL